MFKPTFAALAALATLAALALGPGTALAQRRAGGNVAVGRPAVGHYYGGGARYYGGARSYGGRGYPRYGWGVGVAIGSPWYYGGYAYAPGYYGGGYYEPYPYYPVVPDYSYGAPGYEIVPPAPAQDNKARVRVIVPPGAKLSFGGQATQQDGFDRLFESPPLTPGQDYVYDITAQWRADGKDVTQTRHVVVRANSTVTVDFTQPAPAG